MRPTVAMNSTFTMEYTDDTSMVAGATAGEDPNQNVDEERGRQSNSELPTGSTNTNHRWEKDQNVVVVVESERNYAILEYKSTTEEGKEGEEDLLAPSST